MLYCCVTQTHGTVHHGGVGAHTASITPSLRSGARENEMVFTEMFRVCLQIQIQRYRYLLTVLRLRSRIA